MTGSQIRQQFLDYFAANGHRVVRSSSLVPTNDSTLLFTNAGMNQFKDTFLGLEKRDYSRAASSQKCVRAGGKHNDLENVGYTRRHHTFFEMLGNFSFGDYFKAEAIVYAWELITGVYALPKDRLYVTVFREDDDAEMLWQKVTGIPKSRIFRLDEKDNFWQMGETGPCGPCSEIHYDLGPEASELGRESEAFPSDAGGRFVEIWNLVFMQYDRDSDAVLTPLPRPSIDTGMGLERITAVMQGKLSNYDTDLIRPVVEKAAELFKVTYTPEEQDPTNVSLRINADHARAAAFLVNDGVVPSNEGRGYVLRKIMRRALRHARRLGITDPYLYQLTGFVADLMKGAYPELLETAPKVARVVKDEEHRYATTFHVAERMFQDEAKAATGGVLPGAAAFKLYDTYGLPLEEQEEMAREFGLAIDTNAFHEEMDKQRTRARASWKGGAKAQIPEVYLSLPSTEFIGRDTLEAPVEVLQVIHRDGTTEVVLDRTPFYAESGGQVGDRGVLVDPATGERVAVIEDTYKPAPSAVVHRVQGPVEKGMKLIGRVERSLREATMRNHTATHLLHAALRTVLGKHVKQAGSVVAPDRLRFDFTHFTAMDPEEVTEVERLANLQILANTPVHTEVMGLDSALQTGAMALFGEKYGDKVRVVEVPGFSKELCGGTHVTRTGDIGIMKIVSEGSISAGVRRIEAITGEGALERFQHTTDALTRVSDVLHTRPDDLLDQVQKLLEQQKDLEKQLDHLKTKMAQAEAGNIEQKARDIKGVKVLATPVSGLDRAQLRALVDSLRNKWKSAVVVLGSSDDGSVSVVAGVTKDLTSKVHAGKLVSVVAQAIGGKGGGRPDMAEAGGKDPSALPGALDKIYETIEAML